MAIEPGFFDHILEQIVKNGGDCSNLMPYSGEYLNILCDCRTIDSTTLQQGDIGKIIETFMSPTYSIQGFGKHIIYELNRGRIGFGKIVCFDQPEFEELSMKFESDSPIIYIFRTFWDTFFRNLRFMPHDFLGGSSLPLLPPDAYL
jgi:hypothetical protein